MRVTGHVKIVERKRGDVVYLKWRDQAGQHMRLLGDLWTERTRPPAGAYTQRMAEEALQALLTDARRGTLAGSQPSAGKTFADATAEWLRYSRDERELADSTFADYRNVVARLHEFFGADTPLEKVTRQRADAYRDHLLADGRLSKRTAQKYLVLLHGVMKRAKRREWITTNPVEDIERVRVKRSGDFNVLSPAQVHAVARAAEGQLAAIITVAAFTGLRLGELRALRWGDVDFAGAKLLVRRNLPVHGVEKAPKSGKVRSVPLIDQAARALDELSRREHFTSPDDRVFVSATGYYIDDGEARTGFYAALEAAGLGHVRTKENPMWFHDLRHTFGTLAIRAWPLTDVQAYMGHADISTTMIYVHHQPRVEAAAQLGRLVDAELDVSPFVSRTAENGAQQGETAAAA